MITNPIQSIRVATPCLESGCVRDVWYRREYCSACGQIPCCANANEEYRDLRHGPLEVEFWVQDTQAASQLIKNNAEQFSEGTRWLRKKPYDVSISTPYFAIYCTIRVAVGTHLRGMCRLETCTSRIASHLRIRWKWWSLILNSVKHP
jgi:hypothetical protein